MTLDRQTSMALDKRVSIVSDLRHIMHTAHSISSSFGFSAVATASTSDTFDDEDFSLPPPPSIDPALSHLNVSPAVVERLSDVYGRSAHHFRRISERKLRHAIRACKQITLHSTNSAYNSHLVHVAATQFYLRTVRAMQTIILSSYEDSVKQGRRSLLSANIPKSPALPWITSRHDNRCSTSGIYRPIIAHKVQSSCRKAVSQCPQSPSIVSPPDPFSVSKNQGFFDLRKGRSSVPVYRADHTNEDKNPTTQELVPYAYPARYNHEHPILTTSFASSSQDFFPASRARDLTEPSSRPTDGIIGVLAGVESMHLIERAVEVGSNTCVDGKPGARPCRSTLRRLGSSAKATPCQSAPLVDSVSKHNNAVISLDVSTLADLSQPRRRKCLPMPKRRSLSSVPDQDTSSASLPFPAPSFNRHPSSSTSPQNSPRNWLSDPISPTSASSETVIRRRKVAPLPRRQPNLVCGNAPSTCSSDHDQRTPLASAFPFIQQWPHPNLSRTPSLVSLSSRPESPVDDGPDTPPSSPPPCAVELPNHQFNVDLVSLNLCSLSRVDEFLPELRSPKVQARSSFSEVVIKDERS